MKIWDNYHHDSLLFNINTRQFYYDHTQKLSIDRLTPSYKDSLLKMLSASYLTLAEDGSFEMEDHAIFTPALHDNAWHNLVEGKWVINTHDSTLTLTQQSGLTKCYRLLAFSDKTLILGELFECIIGTPITEISLNRE
ncbi:MAG: hypothetical protein IPP93_17540 [Chitinophagaceae bacterium]|nr:hypothetical protein [Chitinophagaceae bacterium]